MGCSTQPCWHGNLERLKCQTDKDLCVLIFMTHLLKMGVPCREAVRGEDLLLLSHSLSSEGIRAEGSGAGQHETALLAIVEKVESEKEMDGSRKLVAYATVCLAGMVCSNPN
jgi:hypothetical protein